MTDDRIQLDDIDDENSDFEPRYLLLFNKTNLNFGFVYPNRFNKTSVAFLSGAILFLLMNTAYLMMYLTSKMSKRKPNSSYDGNNDNRKKYDSKRKDTEDEFLYEDDYYDYYYYDDIFHNNSSQTLEEKPR